MKNIPNTNLNVSQLSLGTAQYGTGIDEATAFALLDKYVELGGNAIDTANVYGKWGPEGIGTSEIIIGNWMKARGNRENIVLCTKGCHPELATMKTHRMTPDDLKADLKESLENLSTDHVELFYLHRDAVEIPVDEIMDMLHDQVQAGLIHYAGASNWAPKRINAAQEYAEKKGFTGFVANQMMWNLAVSNRKEPAGAGTCGMDSETFTLHEKTGIAAIPYNSQASGLFTKALRDDFESNPVYDGIKKSYLNNETQQRIDAVRQISQVTGADGTQIALAWLLNQPFTTIPIIGCRTVEQLESSFRALDKGLQDIVKEKLKV